MIVIYLLPVIGLANLVDEHRRLYPLLAILTLGIVSIGGLWRMCAAAIKRLSDSEQPAFDATKAVHQTAAFLMLLGCLNFFMNLMIRDLASDGANVAILPSDAMLELFGTGALHLLAAILGVGWVLRRRLSEVCNRLCLRMPTLREAGIGIAAGVGLGIFSTVVIAIWEQSVPAEVFQQQTESAQLYFEAITATLSGGLLLAIIPAVSEEIFYRGALQPVFGLWLTSIFFTLMHWQYGLTPAILILFVVSLGFSWLRLRYHTSVAIIAHAVFNFLPYLTGA